MKKESLFKFSASIFLRMLLTGILCLMIDLTIMPAITGRIGNVVVQLLCFVLSAVLIYSFVREKGNSDVNKVINSFLKEDSYRGLKAGLIACIPYFITSVILLLTKAGVVNDIYISVHAIANSQFMSLILALLPRTLTSGELDTVNFISAAALPLIYPVICGFGYYLGFKRHSISEELIYVKNK